MAACSGGCRAQYRCVPPGSVNMDGTLFDPNNPEIPSPDPAARIIDLEDRKADSSACIAVVATSSANGGTGGTAGAAGTSGTGGAAGEGGTGGEMSAADAP